MPGRQQSVGHVSWLAAKRPDATLGPAPEALLDQLTDHRHEGRMRPCARRANEIQPELGGRLGRLHVEVEQHLDMVRDEADRCDHDVLHAPRRERAQVVEDVRLEPGTCGGPLRLWYTSAVSATPTASATSRADLRSWSS